MLILLLALAVVLPGAPWGYAVGSRAWWARGTCHRVSIGTAVWPNARPDDYHWSSKPVCQRHHDLSCWRPSDAVPASAILAGLAAAVLWPLVWVTLRLGAFTAARPPSAVVQHRIVELQRELDRTQKETT